ncbi:HAMP domain-containing histidine kinase [Phreatobacter aquaticus]|uniref:histidine kinase n=1 Tax=Phreatobacter aquaticus TaxID=2570229 RepID=A0A4D7QK71_9HYPH|nr:HAMP domain-containing sensor histidine kinase [Phreatobacter aquaticus]QCK86099.1 HAMP domain-containing histidine kinase [Phreatobacter aquaticus]
MDAAAAKPGLVAAAARPVLGRLNAGADMLRAIPVRWRIATVVILNLAFIGLLMLLIATGARAIRSAWTELQEARRVDRLLSAIENDAGRLQTLIHRYFALPNDAVLNEIETRRKALLAKLALEKEIDLALQNPARSVTSVTERFMLGFDELRSVRETISSIYENEIRKPSSELSQLYSVVETAMDSRYALVAPSLGKSREAFSIFLVAINDYYLTQSVQAQREASRSIEVIQATAPVMVDLAETAFQKAALQALRERTDALRAGFNRLILVLGMQNRLLQVEIDGNQAVMATVIQEVAERVRAQEDAAQQRLDRTLDAVFFQAAGIAGLFLVFVGIIWTLIARSIRMPLDDLAGSMAAIVGGDLNRQPSALGAADDIGRMARAVEVFRQNAIAKQRAELDLVAAKDRAETALAHLRDTQESLIEAEKLAALGGLVAGVAHEVNNPIGISLTVASTLSRRIEAFGKDVERGELRRSKLTEFVEGSREAASQLSLNLQRAGEMVQAFKQVAVDRSHADRRSFDLAEATDQIVASLRPTLRRAPVTLAVSIPANIVLDSYPGPYGQVVTNLFMNALNHAFPEGRPGIFSIEAQVEGDSVVMTFADDGIGMTTEVQRQAFDPFFTTKRGSGGTGLGLNIVFNIITRRLGGRVTLGSVAGQGTTFRIVLPKAAPFDNGERS